MRLFPIIQPELANQFAKLPLCREIAWDYKTNTPVWRGAARLSLQGRRLYFRGRTARCKPHATAMLFTHGITEMSVKVSSAQLFQKN